VQLIEQPGIDANASGQSLTLIGSSRNPYHITRNSVTPPKQNEHLMR
jgi:hypothetical protein